MNGMLEDRIRAYAGQLDEDSLAQGHGLGLSTSDRQRRVRRGLVPRAVLGIVAGVLAVVAGGAVVRTGQPEGEQMVSAPRGDDVLEVLRSTRLVFPVEGVSGFVDSFGAGRPAAVGGEARGVELFARPGTRVRALRSGTVVEVAGGERGFVSVVDIDGTSYRYGNLGVIPKGLKEGRVVPAGLVLGHIARGSAVGVPPHATVEIRVDGRTRLNPYPLLASLASPSTRAGIEVGEVPGATGPIRVRKDVVPRLATLVENARRAGLFLDGEGLRSTDAQIRRRKANCGPSAYDVYLKPAAACRPPTARVSSGPHEQGVAVDFEIGGRSITDGSPAHRWLTEHASEHRFVGKKAEPWHWEYRVSSP